MDLDEPSISFFLKYLWLPILAVVAYFIKRDLGARDKKLAELEDRSRELESLLTKNYYDKSEIKEHIFAPLSRDIQETRSEIRPILTMLNNIQQDMAILRFKILGDELTSYELNRDKNKSGE